MKNEHTIPSGSQLGTANTFLEPWILNDQDFDKASVIIEEQLSDPEPTEPWTCAKCAEVNDGSFEYCWKCQEEK